MQKIFKVGKGFAVPDGTTVHSIIDPQIMSGLGIRFVKNISLALGEIPPKTTSSIHVHPIVTQITWVISGKLSVRMKDAETAKPYTLDLSSEEAVITEPGTFFQLINDSAETCSVLYIVQPAFLFKCSDKGEILYNDAIVLGEGWDELEKMGWSVPEMNNIEAIARKRDGV